MDSQYCRLSTVLSRIEMLSTPCNGFSEYIEEVTTELEANFQLHVMDSARVYVQGELSRYEGFQLHVMDSALWGALS